MIIRELSNYKNIFNSKILLIHGDNVALKKEYEKKIVKLLQNLLLCGVILFFIYLDGY